MKEINELDEHMISDVCDIVRKHNISLEKKMAYVVANMCNVSVEDMMSESKNQTYLHARWLFWYALRYMTNDSYLKIAKNISFNGHVFAIGTVCNSIKKMSNLISQGTIWTKRWVLLKSIIKEYMAHSPSQMSELFNNNITITITHPKGVNIELKEI